MPLNRPKILAAPLTVIIGNDLGFPDSLPKLVAPERVPVVLGIPEANEGMTESMAMRNGSLQGAYLILAARALGLDCWPMSGFDNAGVDQAFFAGTRIQSNFLCGIGYANPELVYPRGPRLTFDDAGRFA
jgi:3-hydroxypropanoate dehydrogenase